jgi:hypothetical protein
MNQIAFFKAWDGGALCYGTLEYVLSKLEDGHSVGTVVNLDELSN